MPAHVIIGDIHGCHVELQALLDRVGPGPHDHIIALGDLVDRGPESEAVLRFFRDTPNAQSLMGNHEYEHLRWAEGASEPSPAVRLGREQLGGSYGEWLGFMATLPPCIELDEAVLVHGFVEPGVPLARQREDVLVGASSGQERVFDRWGRHWYHAYDGARPVVFGHHDYLRTGDAVVSPGRYYGLDTGVAHGNRLTALVLPAFQIVQVPSRENHWARLRGA